MRTVFVGQAYQVAGGVVAVAEGVSERVGALQRQAVRAVFVVAGGVPCGIGVAHETAFGIVAETGLPFAAVLPQQAAGQPSQAVAVKGGST